LISGIGIGFALGRFVERTATPTPAEVVVDTKSNDDLVRDFQAAAFRASRAVDAYCKNTNDPWCTGNGPNPLQRAR